MKMMVGFVHLSFSMVHSNLIDVSASELFSNNDLHYQVPFWIGVTVIGLLFLSAIIGIIRYCVHALCSIDTGELFLLHHNQE